jgi:undecaprenyl-diphosphatase
VGKNQLLLPVRWMIDREVAVCGAFNRVSRPRGVKQFFVLISKLGDGGVWYAVIFALPWIYGQSGAATSWDMIRVGVVNLMLYKLIKHLTGRARPCALDRDIIAGTAPLDQYSFPSGHTMHAVAFSVIVTTHHVELTWIVLPLSSLIALSRLILGLHYPTDVIAGGVIGGYVASFLVTF